MNNINNIIDTNELIVISKEKKGMEIPDIMALDKNGDLYIFELKREKAEKENLLQVLRYAQIYGNSDYEDLNELYQRSFNQKIDLKKCYFNNFDLDLDEDKYNRKQHFIVISNGIESKTIDAILYWQSLGIDIDAILYWVYKIGNESFIEFDMYSPMKNYQFNNESNSYLLNINKGNDESCHHDMLNNHKAAAYYNPWKYNIEKLKKDDYVFLYQSGEGIVAYGRADGKLKKKDIDGEKNQEYSMNLYDFKKLIKPLTAQKITELIGHRLCYIRTMTAINQDDSKTIIDFIDNTHNYY